MLEVVAGSESSVGSQGKQDRKRGKAVDESAPSTCQWRRHQSGHEGGSTGMAYRSKHGQRIGRGARYEIPNARTSTHAGRPRRPEGSTSAAATRRPDTHRPTDKPNSATPHPSHGGACGISAAPRMVIQPRLKSRMMCTVKGIRSPTAPTARRLRAADPTQTGASHRGRLERAESQRRGSDKAAQKDEEPEPVTSEEIEHGLGAQHLAQRRDTGELACVVTAMEPWEGGEQQRSRQGGSRGQGPRHPIPLARDGQGDDHRREDRKRKLARQQRQHCTAQTGEEPSPRYPTQASGEHREAPGHEGGERHVRREREREDEVRRLQSDHRGRPEAAQRRSAQLPGQGEAPQHAEPPEQQPGAPKCLEGEPEARARGGSHRDVAYQRDPGPGHAFNVAGLQQRPSRERVRPIIAHREIAVDADDCDRDQPLCGQRDAGEIIPSMARGKGRAIGGHRAAASNPGRPHHPDGPSPGCANAGLEPPRGSARGLCAAVEPVLDFFYPPGAALRTTGREGDA